MIQMCNYKVCAECGAILPKSKDFFFSHKHGKDGFENKCKECIKKRRRKRYKNIIYEIYCKEANIYYIGQTIKPITERISKHFSDAKRGRKQPLYEDMRMYDKQAFEYRVLEEVDKQEDLDDKEKYYIKKYLDEGKILYNREYGGRKNIEISEDTREEMSKAKVGKYNDKNHPRAKSVICLTTKRIFYTAKEGAKYYNCNHGSIIQCCKGKYRTAGEMFDGTKLIWKYLVWNHNKVFKYVRDKNEESYD